jgi:type II secretory pathway pseudopilin PulG
MLGFDRNQKHAFPMIELLLTVTLISVAVLMIWPVIGRYIEMANQATDNANARLIYNAAAMWYSGYNTSEEDLEAADLVQFLGLDTYPAARSAAFSGRLLGEGELATG